MIESMTGFATVTRELAQAALTIELRSVNHRYLEIQFRLPDELRNLEQSLREAIGAKIARGKVECRAGLGQKTNATSAVRLDTSLLVQLAQLNREVKSALPEAADLSVADVLRWPGIIVAASASDAEQSCLKLMDEALAELITTRRREGEKLKRFLLEKVTDMERLITALAPRIPQFLSAYQERLAARLKESLVNVEDERIRHEFALFAGKMDVEEEISRLKTHLSEFRRILDKGGTVGKRLDFLVQEINREANTLGSKAIHIEVSQTALELKALNEQMREQIQNIE
ncbi:MAG: YicC/YloC family endoribonuclease [Burkholderiales bacterium]